MIVLIAGLLLIPLFDQATKEAVRARLGRETMPLGALGCLRITEAQIWIVRRRRRPSLTLLGALWLLAAIPLALVGLFLPPFAPFAGLLLGGSLSHLLESGLRGCITDFICLGRWPPFDLADVAITSGAAGLAVCVFGTLPALLA